MLARDPIRTSNPYGALNGRSFSAASASSSPTASVDDMKKRAKKKKKNKSKATSSVTSNDGDAEDADNQDSNHATAPPLPLPRRLEIAACHADLHAALVGLVGWSRLSLHTDAILVFFQSDALRLLLQNVLTARSKNEIVYENLVTLLANCLSIDGVNTSGASNRQVAIAVVGALRAMMERLPTSSDAHDVSHDDATSVETIAAYLSKVVVQYRMSLSGVGVESSLSHDVLKIETQLKAAALKDSDVKGQTIRDSFQRRDIRSEALVLYEARLGKVLQLARESSTQTDHAKDGVPADGGFLAFATQACDTVLHVNENEVEEVKTRLATLEEDKATKMKPIEEKKQAHEIELHTLQQEREALEAKLRAVNDQIQTVLLQQVQLQSEASAIEDAFAEATSRFDEHHQRVLRACQQKERRDQIQDEFTKLMGTISTISLTIRETHSLLDKHATCLRQQLEGALRYFGSELPCVKFMVKRVEDTQAEVQKLLQEASSYDALGVHAVSTELTEKVASMRAHLEEDIECVQALRTRDLEVVEMMERILHDEQHHEALEQLDAHLKKEARRHIDYVKKVHADADAALGASADTHDVPVV